MFHETSLHLFSFIYFTIFITMLYLTESIATPSFLSTMHAKHETTISQFSAHIGIKQVSASCVPCMQKNETSVGFYNYMRSQDLFLVTCKQRRELGVGVLWSMHPKEGNRNRLLIFPECKETYRVLCVHNRPSTNVIFP